MSLQRARQMSESVAERKGDMSFQMRHLEECVEALIEAILLAADVCSSGRSLVKKGGKGR